MVSPDEAAAILYEGGLVDKEVYSQELLARILRWSNRSASSAQIGVPEGSGDLLEDLPVVYDRPERYDCMRNDTVRNDFFKIAFMGEEAREVEHWLEVGPGPYGTLTQLPLRKEGTMVTAVEAVGRCVRELEARRKSLDIQGTSTLTVSLCGVPVKPCLLNG